MDTTQGRWDREDPHFISMDAPPYSVNRGASMDALCRVCWLPMHANNSKNLAERRRSTMAPREGGALIEVP